MVISIILLLVMVIRGIIFVSEYLILYSNFVYFLNPTHIGKARNRNTEMKTTFEGFMQFTKRKYK